MIKKIISFNREEAEKNFQNLKEKFNKKKRNKFLFISFLILIFGIFLFSILKNPNIKKYEPNMINWNIFNISKEYAKSEENKYDFIEIQSLKEKKKQINKEKIIVGIDFGTINSGYSYCIDNDISKITFSGKSPTELETSKITNLGKKYSYEASISLKNYRNEELDTINFIKGIKSIFNLDKFNNDNLCYVYPNEYVTNFNIKNILKEYFIMIQNDILKNIKNPKIKKNQIKYIISVPISWKEFEKQIIINAAYESGMNNIRLIYDNEAASLSMMNDRYIESKYKSDHKIFLSIDAGGYYTNITINEITNSTIKEKIKIKNNIYKNIGILTISEEIIKILEQIFGKNYIDYLKRENPGEWVKTLKDIYSAIESTYCIDGIELFEINSKFNSKGKYEYSFQTEKGINKYIIEYNEYIVTLPAGLVGNIIYKNVRYIMNIIDNIIDEMKLKRININSILVSGGLSKNKIFQNEIENNLKIKIPINYLTSYENAISKGAVFYGIDSDKIKSRISKETIGIRVKENNNNKIKVLIKKGEEIENYSLNIFIKPSLKNQERIQINVYATDNEELSENDFLGRLLLYLNKNNNGIIQLTIKYDIVLNFYAVDYEKEEEIKFDFELFK